MVRLSRNWLPLALLAPILAADGSALPRSVGGSVGSVRRTVAGAVIWASKGVHAYIPAVAVNNTDGLIKSTDGIHIAWLPNGIFR